jgi:hypothetical protein
MKLYFTLILISFFTVPVKAEDSHLRAAIAYYDAVNAESELEPLKQPDFKIPNIISSLPCYNDAMEEALKKPLSEDVLSKVRQFYYELFKKRFSQNELFSMTAFYHSDTGKKLLSQRPTLHPLDDLIADDVHAADLTLIEELSDTQEKALEAYARSEAGQNELAAYREDFGTELFMAKVSFLRKRAMLAVAPFLNNKGDCKL